MAKVLVTGGAGFIGSHLVDALVARGDEVRVVDVRHPFAHLDQKAVLNPKATYLFGNVGGRGMLRRALDGVEIVYHLAAALGMGPSMEYVSGYVQYNTLATAQLLERLVDGPMKVRRLVVASSNSIYGEGPYLCPSCRSTQYPSHRTHEALEKGTWEQTCPECGSEMTPVPTPETKPLSPTSIYAITKRDQEEMSLVVGRSIGLPTIALRFFNVYGPRQSLFNPYAGVCAIFNSKISHGIIPKIYEDGNQIRDMVSVHDIVRALCLAGDSPMPGAIAINAGSGRPTRVTDIARTLGRLHGIGKAYEGSGEFRDFDVRHSYADISLAGKFLGFSPEITLESGLAELIG